MKIKIAYLPGEEKAARTIEEFARVIFPGVKVKKSDRYAPFIHTYLSTKTGEKPCKFRKIT